MDINGPPEKGKTLSLTDALGGKSLPQSLFLGLRPIPYLYPAATWINVAPFVTSAPASFHAQICAGDAAENTQVILNRAASDTRHTNFRIKQSRHAFAERNRVVEQTARVR